MVLEYDTPERLQQARLENLSKKILKDNYVNLKINNFSLKEDLSKEVTAISCDATLEKEQIVFEGGGTGPVAALYNAMVNKLSASYVSLEDVEFVDFSIVAKLKEKVQKSGVDAPVTASLVITNSNRKNLYFQATSHSINRAAIEVVRHSLEFFINSELAVIHLYENVQEARGRNRQDIVEKSTSYLMELVKTTSYEKSIGRVKKLDK